jgi:hypothetical protein
VGPDAFGWRIKVRGFPPFRKVRDRMGHPAVYPTLNPFIYTLENAVPLVKLGQDEKWAPDRRYPGTNWFTNYWFLVWSRWLLILSGWIQATILAAALADRFKK